MLGGDGRSLAVDADGRLAQLLGALLPQVGDDPVEGDVLVVVTDLGLGGRGEDRLRQLGRLGEALGQLDTADGAVLPVLLEPGAGEVAADDTLEREHLQLAADHRAAEDLLRDPLIVGGTGEVVREVQGVEEEVAHRSEDASLVRDVGVQDVVVGGDPVGGHHEEGDVVDLVDLAHFTCGKVRVLGQVRSHGGTV